MRIGDDKEEEEVHGDDECGGRFCRWKVSERWVDEFHAAADQDAKDYWEGRWRVSALRRYAAHCVGFLGLVRL